MSSQQSRPLDTLQNIISSFKKFEKKLDKLQDDVIYHGHTLAELRVMVANLSSGNILNSDNIKAKEPKRLLNKTTTMQFEDRHRFEQPQFKRKRKNAMHTLSSECISKSLDTPKHCLYKIPGDSKLDIGKRSLKNRKSEAPRKLSSPIIKPKKRIKKTPQI